MGYIHEECLACHRPILIEESSDEPIPKHLQNGLCCDCNRVNYYIE